MKSQLLILMGIVSAVFIGCYRQTEKEITGTYVMQFQNEYSRATDTIVVSAINADANTYKVIRNDGFHRIRNGRELPKEFAHDEWTAIFHEENSLLDEGELGRKLYMKPGNQELVFGDQLYRRLR